VRGISIHYVPTLGNLGEYHSYYILRIFRDFYLEWFGCESQRERASTRAKSARHLPTMAFATLRKLGGKARPPSSNAISRPQSSAPIAYTTSPGSGAAGGSSVSGLSPSSAGAASSSPSLNGFGAPAAGTPSGAGFSEGAASIAIREVWLLVHCSSMIDIDRI